MARFGFEKLDVWKKAVGFAGQIYTVTRRFPTEERFGLTNQLRRAAVSIPSNIAGGNSRSSERDRMRFVEIAYGSLMEIVSQLAIARQQLFLSEEAEQMPRADADELARMLSGLKSSLTRNQPEK
ncbi:MAG: four helix bundle protein [Planctomycetaceae bacterium]